MIPHELRKRPQWVVWRDMTKVPYQPNGRHASPTDPDTWVTYEQAVEAAPKDGGIGFVFTESDPYVGLDFDRCRTNGTLDDYVLQVVRQLDSYTEVSPSGTGLHVYVKADLNGHRNVAPKTQWGGKFECYSRGRYFTVTGHALMGTPGTIQERQEHLNDVLERLLPPVYDVVHPALRPGAPLALSDEELLDKARRARNGAKFTALFDNADLRQYGSASEADLALVDEICFWTGPDPDRIDRWFRRAATRLVASSCVEGITWM